MKYPGFPVHNSTLAGPALAQRVLSKYHLPSPISCNFLRNGVNDTDIVKAGSGTYFLRVYRYGWRTKAEIQAELAMLTYLHKGRLPVSWPLERKDGPCLTPIAAPEGVRYAALFTNAPGKGVDWNAKNSCSYGELVGRIHVCLDKAPDSVSDDWSAKAKSKRTRRWNAFLNGYSKVRTLGTHELKATNIFVPIRHIWLLGMHTQLAETSGRGWFDDGYFDFHLRFIKRWLEYRKIL